MELQKLIDKYERILSVLKQNKGNKAPEDKYDYDTDIKNIHEFIEDLKRLKTNGKVPVCPHCGGKPEWTIELKD